MDEGFEGYIFDCDGTLTDSMPLHFLSWQAAMARYGIDFPEERFYGMAGMPTDKIIEILSAEQGIQVDVAQATEEKEQGFLDRISELKPIEFTIQKVHEAIAAGKKVSVASGGTREAVRLQLEAIGMSENFEIRVCAEDTERHKPEPDVFLRAAELMGVAPEKCVVYEDADLGIQAAKAAGMAWVDVRVVE